MKNFNSHIFVYSVITLVLLFIDLHYFHKLELRSQKFLHLSDEKQELDKLMRENLKLNKTLNMQIENINKMNETLRSINMENQVLKSNLTKKISEIEDYKNKIRDLKINNKNNNSVIIIQKDNNNSTQIDFKNIISTIINFNSLMEQIKMKKETEKEIQQNIKSKIHEISLAEERISNMNDEIKSEFSNKIDNFHQTISYVEKSNYGLRERLSQVEKQFEKDTLKFEVLQNKDYISVTNGLECIYRNSCSVCVENSYCVWCSQLKRCFEASLENSLDNKFCSKAFLYGNCDQSECQIYKSKNKCVQNIDCSWNEFTQICENIIENKPATMQ